MSSPLFFLRFLSFIFFLLTLLCVTWAARGCECTIVTGHWALRAQWLLTCADQVQHWPLSTDLADVWLFTRMPAEVSLQVTCLQRGKGKHMDNGRFFLFFGFFFKLCKFKKKTNRFSQVPTQLQWRLAEPTQKWPVRNANSPLPSHLLYRPLVVAWLKWPLHGASLAKGSDTLRRWFPYPSLYFKQTLIYFIWTIYL
jgi:hypothetical protein